MTLEFQKTSLKTANSKNKTARERAGIEVCKVVNRSTGARPKEQILALL